jgi:hypothetical protein
MGVCIATVCESRALGLVSQQLTVRPHDQAPQSLPEGQAANVLITSKMLCNTVLLDLKRLLVCSGAVVSVSSLCTEERFLESASFALIRYH